MLCRLARSASSEFSSGRDAVNDLHNLCKCITEVKGKKSLQEQSRGLGFCAPFHCGLKALDLSHLQSCGEAKGEVEEMAGLSVHYRMAVGAGAAGEFTSKPH